MTKLYATADEMARRIAARVTRQVLVQQGTRMQMYVGCGFPKSGTVWLCELLSSALGVPYPREYRFPIAMPAVIHSHWRYSPRMPRATYIRRDGRDVMVSLYYFYMRALKMPSKPARAEQLRRRFSHLYGSDFDPQAIRENLPRFIEAEIATPQSSDGLSWHQHVEDWWDRPNVAQVAYEDLLTDPVDEVLRIMDELGAAPDTHIASLAVERWSFSSSSGRKPGEEDKQSFHRKGVAGDWKNHFSLEAGEVFDAHAGDALTALGYAQDRDWFRDL